MSLFNFFGTDEEQARADALQAQLTAMDQDYAPGGKIYIRIQKERGTAAANDAWRQVQKNLKAADQGDVGDQVKAEFNDAIASEVAPVTGAINATLKAPFQFAWDAIPWQVWALGAVLLFFYMGGWKMLKGILK